ncbi:MAG TPA: CHASE4 domain-containing protein [Jatrophihabitans sp.]|nr:CHASE4 domain-containing protein [Jatrophihabitans sp.]
MWDDSYLSVKNADEAAFSSAFEPDSIHSVFGLDGIVGVGPDGRYRTGGLVAAGDRFARPPASLASQQALTRLSGAQLKLAHDHCGLTDAGALAYLFCGYPAYDTNGTHHWGSLIYLKALDRPGIDFISRTVKLDLAVLTSPVAGGMHQPALHGLLGSMTVATRARSADAMEVGATVRTVDGSPVVFRAVVPRPMHKAALDTSAKLFAFMILLGLLLGGLVMWFVQHSGAPPSARCAAPPTRSSPPAIAACGSAATVAATSGSWPSRSTGCSTCSRSRSAPRTSSTPDARLNCTTSTTSSTRPSRPAAHRSGRSSPTRPRW